LDVDGDEFIKESLEDSFEETLPRSGEGSVFVLPLLALSTNCGNAVEDESNSESDFAFFTLTAASSTLKRLLFPNFLDSEMGHDYVLEEETRDPEHP